MQDNHKCVEKSMHHNCPICFEFLFDSIRPTSVLRCGHTIHSECFADMQRNGMLACPVCLKSVSDCSHVWRSIDAEVAAAPMPEEYLGCVWGCFVPLPLVPAVKIGCQDWC